MESPLPWISLQCRLILHLDFRSRLFPAVYLPGTIDLSVRAEVKQEARKASNWMKSGRWALHPTIKISLSNLFKSVTDTDLSVRFGQLSSFMYLVTQLQSDIIYSVHEPEPSDMCSGCTSSIAIFLDSVSHSRVYLSADMLLYNILHPSMGLGSRCLWICSDKRKREPFVCEIPCGIIHGWLGKSEGAWGYQCSFWGCHAT